MKKFKERRTEKKLILDKKKVVKRTLSMDSDWWNWIKKTLHEHKVYNIGLKVINTQKYYDIKI